MRIKNLLSSELITRQVQFLARCQEVFLVFDPYNTVSQMILQLLYKGVWSSGMILALGESWVHSTYKSQACERPWVQFPARPYFFNFHFCNWFCCDCQGSMHWPSSGRSKLPKHGVLCLRNVYKILTSIFFMKINMSISYSLKIRTLRIGWWKSKWRNSTKRG